MIEEHVSTNRQHWNERASDWVGLGERAWAGEPSWGEWGASEDELRLLPTDMTGMRAVELGCGTGYVSAWMIRRGASVVGVDVSIEQLATARRLADDMLRPDERSRVEFVEANAEDTPLESGEFDFAISEYGACLWCEPVAWLTEARRLLTDDGTLTFLSTTPWPMACSPLDGSLPVTERLERPYFGDGVYDWRSAADEPGGIEFVPTIGQWFEHFSVTGFQPVRYLEIQNKRDRAASHASAVTPEWASRWPHEHVWVLKVV